ncbi:MAG: hypothetical protein ACHQFW_10280, partial [Chitinophagales bacterium]
SAMYIRERKLNDAISNRWWKRTLFALRFLAVAIIAVLLLNPYMKSRFNQTEKPIIVILQDNSSSIKTAVDSVAQANLLTDLNDRFSDNYDVQNYVFGEKIESGLENLDFNDKSTDLSSALNELNNLYENLNVGAIILASDGIYNSGSNPVYVKNDLGAPIYTIALGDTIQKKDVRISRALHNNIVYLNDRFTISTEIEAIFCNGTNPKITVTELTKGNNKILGEKNIPVNSEQFNTIINWEIAADAPGIRHYQIRIQPVENESTTDNNIQDVFVEVLDARQKILLLANSPHPDINAIKQSIESNQNYEIDIKLASEFKGSVAEYNLVIFHQLPSTRYPVMDILGEIKEKSIPQWFITGNQTSINLFNKAQSLVNISSSGLSSNEVTATTEKSFNLFTLDDKTISVFPKLPALNASYGQYNVSPAAQVLLYQKIGAVATKSPLLIYSLPGREKSAVLCAENIWKWRIYDYVLNKDQNATNDLVSKTVQYLAAKNDRKQFRASQTKNVLNENESVVIDAELYNDSYQLVNEPDATIVIKNDEGKDFPFQFSKTDKSYTLNGGYFPAGNYTYNARVIYNGKTLTDDGVFSISPVRLETLNTTANHKLLNQLSVQSGGQMLYPNQAAELESLIAKNASAKPVLREITKTQSIINLKWIFFVVFFLLGMEWFVRKFNGSY